jgi:hypothetical protein
MSEYRAVVKWYWQQKTEAFGEKPVPVPRFPPQIPRGLTWTWSRASAVRSRGITAWATARTKRSSPLSHSSSQDSNLSNRFLHLHLIYCSRIHRLHDRGSNYVPLKRRSISTGLHGAISQKQTSSMRYLLARKLSVLYDILNSHPNCGTPLTMLFVFIEINNAIVLLINLMEDERCIV